MKSLLKHLICSILYYSGILHLYIKLNLQKKKSFPVVIINYHRFLNNLNGVIEDESVVNHLIKDFEREVSFIRRYFEISSLDKVTEILTQGKIFNRPTVAITVDDGYKNNFELLFPFLKKNNIPVTIFLTAGLVGTNERIWVDKLEFMFLNTDKKTLDLNGIFNNKKYSFVSLKDKRMAYSEIIGKMKDMYIKERDTYLAEIQNKLEIHKLNESPIMLNWKEIQIMLDNNISFGAHTCTHPILTNMPLEEAKKEIFDSKKLIDEHLGIKIKHFAYPNGRPQDFNEDLRQFCKDIGFESISTCDFGNNSKQSDTFGLKRIGSYVPISIFAVNLVRSFLIND